MTNTTNGNKRLKYEKDAKRNAKDGGISKGRTHIISRMIPKKHVHQQSVSIFV